MSKAISIAKEFLRHSYSDVEVDPLTNLRLRKLLYYAQAWSLVLRERQLFPEELEAWRYGPVVREVYYQAPHGGGAEVILADALAEAPDALADEIDFVTAVWDAYKSESAIGLSISTHQELPWKTTWGKRPPEASGSDPIPIEVIEEFFGQRTIPAPLQAYRQARQEQVRKAASSVMARPPFDVDRLRAAAKVHKSPTA
jgi:uncharacterized phage-associated protein